MVKITVYLDDYCKTFQAPEGITLLEALKKQNFSIESPCNGKGSCGKCRVLVHNSFPYTPEEKLHLSSAEISKGIHLSCMVKIQKDMEVTLYNNTKNASIVTKANVLNTKGKPLVQKRFVKLLPPSINDQAPDDQRLINSIRENITNNLKNINILRHFPLSLLKQLPDTLRQKAFNVTLIDIMGNPTGVESGDTTSKNFGVAVDIGTTTLAAYLYDLNTGKQIKVASLLNPQKKYGSDVISRIEYSAKSSDNQSEMASLIRNALNTLITRLSKASNILPSDIYVVTLAGNTIMLHLLLELPSANMASAPFIPVTLSELILEPYELSLNINQFGRIIILPSISAYVGADTTSAILSTLIHKTTKINLLIDIGTNGEIVIGNNSFLYSCSTAAGPAFEGANIACGVGGVDGAISEVSVLDNGSFKINTIRGYKPVGICGSGLIDAVSCMLQTGIIDETGRILDRDEISDKALHKNRLIKINNQQAFLLVPAKDTSHSNDIYISQKDIREIQNAKAAIAAGINILIREADLQIEDIQSVYLAGGFGSFINIDSAMTIGLLPKELSGRIHTVGNAAGAGAIHSLLSEDKLAEASATAKQVSYLELSSRSDFTFEYTENMFFDI